MDLLYSSGIRIQELENLNVEDVNIENRECIVFGKGSKYYFYIFSKAGFTEHLMELQKAGKVKLVTLKDLYA